MTTLEPVNQFVSDVKNASGQAVARVEIFKPCFMLPRLSGGIDWGVTRKVILQYKDIKLFWTKGHTGWVSRGSSGYYEGSVNITGPWIGSAYSMQSTGISLRSDRDLNGVTRLSAILKTDTLRNWVVEKLGVPPEVVDMLRQSHTVVVHTVY